VWFVCCLSTKWRCRYGDNLSRIQLKLKMKPVWALFADSIPVV